ncbi:MAG: winged helix-turn-helix domain-containing protein [Candidatus Bathyarchaeia archaeon]
MLGDDAPQSKLSPSAKFVLKVLRLNDGITQRDIIRETHLPPRTVKYAVKRLKESGLIQEGFNLNDMRRKYYWTLNKITSVERRKRSPPLCQSTGDYDRIDPAYVNTATLDGSRVIDLPPKVIDMFENQGLFRGTDYFFGKIDGHNVRVQLCKDSKGKYRLFRVHLTQKMPTKEEVDIATKRIKQVLTESCRVIQREGWLDVSVGMDISDGKVDPDVIEDIKAAIGELVNTYRTRIGRAFSS